MFDKSFIDAIQARTPRDDNTYTGEDGILYCKNCHTRREVWCDWTPEMGGRRKMTCICKCMKGKYEAEENERKSRERMDLISRYRAMGFSGDEFRCNTFQNDDRENPKISDAMIRYCGKFAEWKNKGQGILLYGDVGTGKSYYAAAICNRLIDEGYPCLMSTLSRLSMEITAAHMDEKQERIDRLRQFSLIAIDDFGVERNTEYMNESVTTIIDAIYRSKIPMIITSNITPRQMAEETDIRRKRVYDRILERCFPVEVSGGRRKDIGRDAYMEMKCALGL